MREGLEMIRALLVGGYFDGMSMVLPHALETIENTDQGSHWAGGDDV